MERKIEKYLANRSILITGATGGLGKAFCQEVIKYNSNLILTGTSNNKLNNLKKELLLINKEAKIKYFACDLSNKESIYELLEFLQKNKIKIDFLINNAGYIIEGSIKHTSIETLLKCIQVNCEGTVHLTKALLDMKDSSKRFDLITITSMASNYPMPYMAVYSSTKAFLNNFMLSLRNEYKKDNVNVLLVKPGAIATSKDMIDAINAQGLKGKFSSISPNKIAKNSIKLVLKNKWYYIPGFFNKITIKLSCLLPQKFQISIIANMWRKSQIKRNIK